MYFECSPGYLTSERVMHRTHWRSPLNWIQSLTILLQHLNIAPQYRNTLPAFLFIIFHIVQFFLPVQKHSKLKRKTTKKVRTFVNFDIKKQCAAQAVQKYKSKKDKFLRESNLWLISILCFGLHHKRPLRPLSHIPLTKDLRVTHLY